MSSLSNGISKLDFDPAIKERLMQGNDPVFFGEVLSRINVAPETVEKILEIPSEVSTEERLLLYNLFAHFWSGTSNVLELGPFIGGTTRPIGLGMHANPNRQSNVKLYSFDWFTYRSGESLLTFLEPLFEKGLLEPSFREVLQDSNDVFQVFQQLHSPTVYGEFLDVAQRRLPNEREDMSDVGQLLMVNPATPFEIVFVDACKTWFSMKYFLLEMTKVTKPGATIILQDYGWFTCYWLPIICSILKDHFKLHACMITTYVFELTKPLEVQQIMELVPDNLEGMEFSVIEQILNELTSQASRQGDTFGEVAFQLQLAMIVATLGDSAKAYSIIEQLHTKSDPRWLNMIGRAHRHVQEVVPH